MNEPMIIWWLIVGVLLAIFVLRKLGHNHSSMHGVSRSHRRIIEIGKEKDMFYLPGDSEDDEFDD